MSVVMVSTMFVNVGRELASGCLIDEYFMSKDVQDGRMKEEGVTGGRREGGRWISVHIGVHASSIPTLHH